MLQSFSEEKKPNKTQQQQKCIEKDGPVGENTEAECFIRKEKPKTVKKKFPS